MIYNLKIAMDDNLGSMYTFRDVYFTTLYVIHSPIHIFTNTKFKQYSGYFFNLP